MFIFYKVTKLSCKIITISDSFRKSFDDTNDVSHLSHSYNRFCWSMNDQISQQVMLAFLDYVEDMILRTYHIR